MNERFKNILIASLILIIIGLLLIFIPSPNSSFKGELSSIGLSLITAGIIAISLDKISLSAISGELNRVLERGIDEIKIRKYGVTNIEDQTAYSDIHKAIEDASEFTLLQTWSPDMKTILTHCEVMLAKGGALKVFLLHPKSCAALQRSSDLEEDLDYVPNKILSDTKQLRAMYQKLLSKNIIDARQINSKIQLYYYSSQPAFALYKTNKKAWVAFYWQKIQSDSAMNIILDCCSTNAANTHFENHIKSLEENSVNVDLSINGDTPLPNNDALIKASQNEQLTSQLIRTLTS